jgi:uncharacterized protein
VNPFRQWRMWVLALLLVGPVLAYLGLGMLWLWQHGWIVATVSAVAWIAAGGAFAVLADRWTRISNPLMPPLDWDAPQTFSPLDREAWKLVQEEADRAESLPYESFLGGDVYIETGRRLLNRLAAHYHPDSTNLLDDVPLVELLTACELAAEDLTGLCRNVPGGDLTTLSHWKRAVQLSGYISKANDLYSYLVPFLNPVGGLARLGTREWIVKPAWKSMQQNVLRWFFQAYVNRIGVHLIELLSGRLAIGANQYRRLTRRTPAFVATEADEIGPLVIAAVGARGAGKSRLVAVIKKMCAEQSVIIKARLASLGLEPALLLRLNEARWIEAPPYSIISDNETRRDRAERQVAVAASVDCDLLILVVDGRRQDHVEDIAFAKAWDRWFQEHPQREVPPTLVVITGVDRMVLGDGWNPPYDWTLGQGPRESKVRSQLDILRSSFPPVFHEIVAAGLGDETPFGVLEHVIPGLANQLVRAERTALIRRLNELSNRSKVGRLAHQLGETGRSLWGSLKARHGARARSR